MTALLQSYTPQSAQAELERIFSMQYTLTLTEEVEIRYRTATSPDPETGETPTEEVPSEYYILNVKLTTKLISELAEELAERGARYGTRKFKQGYRCLLYKSRCV